MGNGVGGGQNLFFTIGPDVSGPPLHSRIRRPLDLFRLRHPMLSLYSALLAQNPRQLTPVRCAEPTIVQLQRYFEDVVLENNLAALVVESMLPEPQRSLRDIARARTTGRAARHALFFV